MTQPEFSRLFELALANERAIEDTYEANGSENMALARRFDVASLSAVKVDIVVAPHALGHLLTGRVAADVAQNCVVTGQALVNQVDTSISYLALAERQDLDLESIEEAYGVSEAGYSESQEIDLGELAAQYLGLAIDPYPRTDGATLDKEAAGQNTSPFAVLARLKDKG